MLKILIFLFLATGNAVASNELYVDAAPNGDKYFILAESIQTLESGIVTGVVRKYKNGKKLREDTQIMVNGCSQHGGNFRFIFGRFGTWSWREDGTEFVLDVIPTKICQALGFRKEPR